MKILQYVRRGLLGLLGLFIVTLIVVNIETLAVEKKWDLLLSDSIDPAMSTLRSIVDSSWFWAGFWFVCGATAGTWFTYFLYRDKATSKQSGFRLKITNSGCGYYKDSGGRTNTAFIALVNLKNKGAPDTPEKWEMIVKSAAGAEIPIKVTHFQHTINLDFPEIGQLTPDKAIYEKSNYPLSTGKLIGGFIIGVASGLEVTRAELIGATISVNCFDDEGNESRASQTYTGKPSNFSYDPALGPTNG